MVTEWVIINKIDTAFIICIFFCNRETQKSFGGFDYSPSVDPYRSITMCVSNKIDKLIFDMRDDPEGDP